MAFSTKLTPPERPRLDPVWPWPIWQHARGGPISVGLMTEQQLRNTRAMLGRWLASPTGETNEVLAMWWSVIDDEIMGRIRLSRVILDSRK